MSDNGGFTYPDSWAQATLSDLGTWQGGGTPSKRVKEYWDKGTVPWVSPKDMKLDFIESTRDSITDRAVKESATNLIPANSVLMVTRSGILRHTFPVAVTTKDVTINQDLKALTLHDGIESRYVAAFLRSRNQPILEKCSKDGTTVNSIEFSRLAKLSLPVAPSAEQRRIVSKIHELFSDIEEGERALERVQVLVERYRQSVLKAAVTGELTREWREQHEGELESGEALLQRILHARREAWEKAELEKMAAKGQTPKNDDWKRKYKEPQPPDTTDLPELPEGWVWVSMDALIRDFITGPFGSALHKSDYVKNKIPLVNPVNMQSGQIVPDANITIDSITFQRLARYALADGDVVIARRGEMGRCAAVGKLERNWICGTGSAILRSTAVVLSDFLALVISSDRSRRFLEENCVGTTMKNLNQEALKKVPVPLPPLLEQQRVLKRTEALINDSADFDSTSQAELTRSLELKQAILRAAFAGKLVPQDPNDEPASVLLQRIAAERAAAEPNCPGAAGKRGPRRSAKATDVS